MESGPAGRSARRPVLGTTAVTLLTFGIITSLHGLAPMATFGLGSLFFYLLATLTFLIPAGLVSAELSTAWPQTGGVYVWVTAAFGERVGFMAIWLQWFQNVIWFTSMLSFAAITVAWPFDAGLATDERYIVAVVVGVLWLLTLATFRGIRVSGAIGAGGAILGTLLPALVLTGAAVVYLAQGRSAHVDFSLGALLPDLDSAGNVVFAAGAILMFAGIEVMGHRVEEIRHPGRTLPRSIGYATALTLVAIVPTTLAVAVVVPASELHIAAGIVQAVEAFFGAWQLAWVAPILGILIFIDALGEVAAWMLGPTSGLLVAARDGNLPALFGRTNARNAPTTILLCQALISTLLTGLFLLTPTISSSFWVLIALSVQVYLVMYVLMYAAALQLRRTRPEVHRPYRVPGGRSGLWIVAGVGIAAALAAIGIGFVPPRQLEVGDRSTYAAMMAGGLALFLALPLALHRLARRARHGVARGGGDEPQG